MLSPTQIVRPRRVQHALRGITCPVIHLVVAEGLSSVFEPMVVAPVARLQQCGVDTRLVVFSPIGQSLRADLRRRWRSKIESIRHTYARPIYRLFSPPARKRQLWSEGRVLQRWLKSHIGNDGPAILHCRGPEATELAVRVRAVMPELKIIFDMRGLVDEEYLCQHDYSSSDSLPEQVKDEYQRLKRIQQIAIGGADAIFCVSYAMADYAISHLGAAAEDVSVLPCASAIQTMPSESDRVATRKQLRLNDRFVISFSGASQRWQSPQRSAKLFQLIKQLHSNAHLLVLTTDPLQIRHELEAANLSQNDMTILSVPHSQIPQHLAAADLGLLLRDGSLVNAVASPVKFAEFLSCGVPVAISENVGDFSQLVRQRQIGFVLPSDSDDASIIRQLREFFDSYDREHLVLRCREVAEVELNFDNNIERTLQIYERLCGSSCESCT